MNDENKEKGERLTHHKLFKAKKIHQNSYHIIQMQSP